MRGRAIRTLSEKRRNRLPDTPKKRHGKDTAAMRPIPPNYQPLARPPTTFWIKYSLSMQIKVDLTPHGKPL